MKYLLVIGCLLLVTDVIRANKEAVEVLQEFITPCAEENNIMPEEMSKFDDLELEGEDRTRFGCMKACVMKKTGILVGTEIQEDKYREMVAKMIDVDADKLNEHMEIEKTCVEEVKDITDECELAFTFTRCVAIKAST